jgi:ADP-ribosylglycohydrolase
VSSTDRLQQVTASMLWAAWADALGFISELTDANGLRRRLGGDGELTEPVGWTRKVGGRFGVSVSLPPGCYSDDTQLRLATSRALSPRGFDIEAFTAVELTLWPAYALGGGRASKSAAAGFTKPNTPWFANFFEGWTNAGGNGAAMRIQPHVWAAPRPDEPGDHLRDVLLNSITTHGHPRALVGAALHAVALGQTLASDEVPGPDSWLKLLDQVDQAFELLCSHDMVAEVWLPCWEQTTNRSLRHAWRDTVDETRSLLTTASDYVQALADDQTPQGETYAAMGKQLGLYEDATRGSGTATVVAALALAAAHHTDPRQCALVASRALGTDTDTVATMAAAIVGAATGVELPTPVQDGKYFADEARRLVGLSEGVKVESTRYPDLLTWQPPKSQLDAVGLVDGRPALAGLALLEPLTEVAAASSRSAHWRWFRSDLGTSFLLKYRTELQELPAGNRPLRQVRASKSERAVQHEIRDEQLPLLDNDRMNVSMRQSEEVCQGEIPAMVDRHTARDAQTQTRVDVDQMLAWVKGEGYSDGSIGYAVRRIATLGTVEQLTAFTATLRHEINAIHTQKSEAGQARATS